MADLATTNGPDALEETLNRLSKKAGVKATIALDRSSGSILKTAGQISLLRPSSSSSNQQQIQSPSTATQQDDSAADGTNSNTNDESKPAVRSEAEELAGMVWGFVNAAGGLVEGLDAEDELKLLRVRTKKQELVIVPDAKYLLIVIHETPAA